MDEIHMDIQGCDGKSLSFDVLVLMFSLLDLWFLVGVLKRSRTLSPIIMVQWKMAGYLKGNDPIAGNHFSLNHDYGRKGYCIPWKFIHPYGCFQKYGKTPQIIHLFIGLEPWFSPSILGCFPLFLVQHPYRTISFRTGTRVARLLALWRAFF